MLEFDSGEGLNTGGEKCESNVSEFSSSEVNVSDEICSKEADNGGTINESVEIANEGSETDFESNLLPECKNTDENLTPQEIAEQAHDKTKENMISEHGSYMSQEQVSMLESDETKEKLTVMSSEEYTETFPDVDVNVLGHCDSEGNIYMKDISPEITEHVSTHETMHLCANREVAINEDGSKTIISGLRESRIYENGHYTDSGMAVNEGATEMYTMRELQNRGEYGAAYSISSYSEARMWSERMEKVVGEDKMAEAYFGGKRQELKDEFNRLNGNNPEAWDNYNRDIHTLQFGHDPELIREASLRVNRQFSIMVKNKYGIGME